MSAVPAEVRLSKLLFGKPRTNLQGGKDAPFVEVKAAVLKAAEETNGIIEPAEFKAVLDWHGMKCTTNDLQDICRQSRGPDGFKIDVNKVLDRLERVHAGSLKVTAPKTTIQELRKNLETLLKSKFTNLYAAFKRFDKDNSGDITAEEFRDALANFNFFMDDETFELFCSDWMDKSSTTKLNVTGNINYEAFKRKYGGVVVSGEAGEFSQKFHDESMRRHLQQLHARDEYTKLRYATGEKVIGLFTDLLKSRFKSVNEAFQALDANRSGSIDTTEFQQAIEKFINLRMKDDEYEKVARHFRFNLNQPMDFQHFKIAFGSTISGGKAKKSMADRNDEFLAKHNAKVAQGQAAAALGTTTAANAAKQFTSKLGNKFDKLRLAFNSMDLDGSGSIEPDEFRSVLLGYNLRMSDSEWEKFLSGYKRDSSNRITREEFYKKFGPLIQGDYGDGSPGNKHGEERARMLKKVNKNQKTTGTVTAEVATKRLQEIIASKYDDIRKAFHTMDQDNSGEIETSEFRTALERFNLVMTDSEFAKFVSSNGLSRNKKINFSRFQQKFAKLITGKFEGHQISADHDQAVKEHQAKVLERQGIMPIKLDAKLIHKEKEDKLNQVVPSGQQGDSARSGKSAKSAKSSKPKAAPGTAKAPDSPPKPKPREVRYMSLLDGIQRLETLLGKKARKLPAALIAMDLNATSTLKPEEARRVLAQFGINLTAKDFRQLCKLYDCWEDGVANYVVLAKGFGADLAQRVYDVSPQKKAQNKKIVADAKIALREGQELLKDKLRNSYEKVVAAMHNADTGKKGYILDTEFVSVLARIGGVRLTKAELSAFCQEYNKPSLRFDTKAARYVDYKKFSKLFDPMRHPVDYDDPNVKKKFSAQNEEAEAYLRDKLRNAYPKVLRAFKAMMANGESDKRGMLHAAFRRLLTRYSAVRMTNDEWDGFISKYDADRDGYISFDELKMLFKDYTERDHAAREKAANARKQVVIDRNNRRERARQVEQTLIGPAIGPEGAENDLAVHFQNKIDSVEKTFLLLDRAGDGMLPRDDFHRAVARTGLQLTIREMDALSEKYDPERKCRVNIADFMAAMRTKIAVLQANTINPVRVERLFKAVQELLSFKFATAAEAFETFDVNKSGLLEPNEWAAAIESVGMAVTLQELTALARYLDTRSNGEGVSPVAFAKLWQNLPGTPATELTRALETWARRSGGKSPEQLMREAEESFRMLDGQNERALPLLEFVAALSAVGIRLVSPETTLLPFKQKTRYNYALLLDRMADVLAAVTAKWAAADGPASNAQRTIVTGSHRAPTRTASAAQMRRSPTGSSERRGSPTMELGSPTGNGPRSPVLGTNTSFAVNASSRSPSRSASRSPTRSPTRSGAFPPIGRSPRNSSGGVMEATSRTLPDGKRAALEAKLRAAQMGKARSPRVSRNSEAGSPHSTNSSPAKNANETDFEHAAFACWKKLRALFVSADKRRSGHLPFKTVANILLRNYVGTSREEVETKTREHTGEQGVNYNQFIRGILQSKSR